MTIEMFGARFDLSDCILIVIAAIEIVRFVTFAHWSKINGRHIREQTLFHRARTYAHIAEDLFKGDKSDGVKMEYVESNMDNSPNDGDLAAAALFVARKKTDA